MIFDELRLLTGCSIELVLADEDDLHKFIRAHYGVGGDTLDAMSREHAVPPAGVTMGDDLEHADLTDDADAANEASVIRLVNELLVEAIKSRATDVHIEPYERRLIVRYRVDGVLTRASVARTIDQFASSIISRIKIMANLNIAEKRKPQDGRISFTHKRQSFDLRVKCRGCPCAASRPPGVPPVRRRLHPRARGHPPRV